MVEHIPSVVIWGDGAGSTFRATADAIDEGIVDFEITGVITTDPEAGILDHVATVNSEYGMDVEPLVIDGRPGRRQDEGTQEHILRFMDRLDTENLVLMGALVIMGHVLVEELNGSVPEEPLPKTLEGARQLMVPINDRFGNNLPADFPKIGLHTGQYGLTNTHPAPTIVTANTHGIGSQRRMIDLRAAESAQTFHVVAPGIDTGPIIAAHRFPIEVLPEDASEEDKALAAAQLNLRAQRIEKAHLPLDVEMQLRRQHWFYHGYEYSS